MKDPNPGGGVTHWELTLLVRDLRERVETLEKLLRAQGIEVPTPLSENKPNSIWDRLRKDADVTT